MRQRMKLAGLFITASAGLWITGCFTGGVYQVPEHESLSGDLSAETTPRVARSQQPEPPDPTFRPPLAPPLQPPPLPPTLPSNPTPSLPPTLPGNSDIKQTNLTAPARKARVTVRAYINGKPIFDEEVWQQMPQAAMRDLGSMPDPQRTERMAEIYNQTLDNIIDQEVAYQDAVNKLKDGNPKALKELKKISDREFEKRMKSIRDSGKVSEAELKDAEFLLKRSQERSLISGEYMRSRIDSWTRLQASHLAVKDYYDKHLNEFQRQDQVQWQDVFIAVGNKFPNVEAARRYAEDLVVQCRTSEDFNRLIQFDEGDSKFRNGAGLGSVKGQIKPAELEETLFRLREGEIGPVVALSTGVHIIRVTKREFAGVMPLDEKTQKLIENKIKNQVAEHEYKRIIRELRTRAVIEVNKEP
jgi:parvulin-like peptidyl-prolyl isomerase